MQKTALLLVVLFCCRALVAQPGTLAQQTVKRPKLVVGIVVDQMRWDYLYRYYDRYLPNGGFKRLLQQGFSCENTLVPYTPAYTACGHSCIYTGSVPAINGITGNSWWDNNLYKEVDCTQDDSAKTVGSNTELGQMSPHNLKVTTICDELKLATNFRAKTIGIAIKDRSSILPAGHSADAAYWYDNKTGNWISSTYYMNELPQWVKDFNDRKLVNTYYAQGWNTLYPINTYLQSTDDNKPYEYKPFGGNGFPYNLQQFAGKNYGIIDATPYGNMFTFELAKAGISAAQLGVDSITDFLSISLSSTDYIGHTFGPNSIEAEDTYLRLDRDLGNFLNFLDEKTGAGQYLLFLTADHGTAHVPAFLEEHKIPAGHLDSEKMREQLNATLKQKFGEDKLVAAIENYQVFLNHPAMLASRRKPDEKEIRKWVAAWLMQQPGIARVVETDAIATTTLPAAIKEALTNGYYPARSGDIQFIPDPQWIVDFEKGGTTHGVWNPYDAHIPLVWYGWNIRPGNTSRKLYMTDIAPSLAALLHIQTPSGCIGQVIDEIMH
jgi:predicted AlkP superfamily pyrophosphatase or phosphodiesterase